MKLISCDRACVCVLCLFYLFLWAFVVSFWRLFASASVLKHAYINAAQWVYDQSEWLKMQCIFNCVVFDVCVFFCSLFFCVSVNCSGIACEHSLRTNAAFETSPNGFTATSSTAQLTHIIYRTVAKTNKHTHTHHMVLQCAKY